MSYRLPFSFSRAPAGAAAAILVSVLVLGALLSPRAEGSERYKAMLSVNGGMTVTSQYDTLRDCQPGQSWTLQENGDVSIRGRIIIEGFRGRDIRTTSAVTKGGATSRNELTSYEESNYCPPDDPIELEPPPCKSFTGKGAANLQKDGRNRKPWRVSVGMSRTTGGAQDIDCMSLGLGYPTPKGTLLSPLENIYSSIVLPLDLRVSSFRKLGVGKKLIRTIRVGGNCDRPIVYRGSKISKAGQTDCSVEGVFNVEIKRLTKSSKKGVSISSLPRK